MFGLIFDNRPWFAPKRFGYGAGLPITWQGWALTLSYGALVTGASVLATRSAAGPRGAAIVMILVGTAGFIAIVHRRTAGGWRWRWGSKD